VRLPEKKNRQPRKKIIDEEGNMRRFAKPDARQNLFVAVAQGAQERSLSSAGRSDKLHHQWPTF
jgi:hypothetical protein